jgi:hypothetical protein
MFYRIAWTGKAPPALGPQDRLNLLQDLRAWRGAVVVLHPRQMNADLMRKTMTKIIGFEPSFVDGVWLWDVRSLVD